MRTSACLALLLFATPLAAETSTYRVLFAGDDTGHLVVDRRENRIAIDFDYKQNGRGPTIAEELTLDDRGFPSTGRSPARRPSAALWMNSSGLMATKRIGRTQPEGAMR